MAFIEVDGDQRSGVASHWLTFDRSAGQPTLVAGWSEVEGLLTVQADRLGMVPLFYALESGRILVSDTLQEVVSRLANRRIDDEAVATFLVLGYLLGNQTLVEGVKVLMPGETLVWSHGSLSSDWSGYPDYGTFSGTRDEAKETFCHLFASAIAKRSQHGVGNLPLSGGRDSRHICLELARQGTPPPATLVLQGFKGDESAEAQQVSAHLGLECRVVAKRGGYASQVFEKNRLNFYSTDENSWYLNLLPHLNGPVFDGLAGDVLCNGSYFDSKLACLIRAGDSAGAVQRLLNGGEYLAFLRSRYRAKWGTGAARQALQSELGAHTDAADPVKSFIFWNRIRREIALLPLVMATQRSEVCLPYEDPELLAFFMSLPWEVYSTNHFHDEVIRESYPEAAHIPYSGNAKKRSARKPFRRLFPEACRMAGALLSPQARPERIAAYMVESLIMGRLTPLSPSFSKLTPVVQAVREMGLDVD